VDYFSWEKPRHQVNVSAFSMGKYAVTQKQWQQIVSLPKIMIDLDSISANFKGDDLPVENINWNEAVEFCERLSKKTGKTYRLPSEAEWEYACRAGTTTPFHFGATITGEIANYDATYVFDQEAKGNYRQKTTSVGSFSANVFGLYDMHGNVWEWCADIWDNNYEGAPNDGTAWIAKNDQNNLNRVLRGGSWFNDPWDCRSASRSYDDAGLFGNYGFRVVCSASRTF
jgi:formylglycine-generating enzyme required for sulfatase activity